MIAEPSSALSESCLTVWPTVFEKRNLRSNAATQSTQVFIGPIALSRRFWRVPGAARLMTGGRSINCFHPALLHDISQGSSIMNTPLERLNEWHIGHDYLLVLLETANAHLTLRTEGFIRDLASGEVTLILENTGEIHVRLNGAKLDHIEATEDVSALVIDTVIVKWPGFRLSLSLLREQPVIHYCDDSD
jgi:hypothetical protein